ncbi:MAG: hypothetical protein E6Q88_04475 [Lysobacteraceae bacterium]|nr:MAG: hypothetical protein E6Q88_04475 [Xanthomonadaceae bacterium]
MPSLEDRIKKLAERSRFHVGEWWVQPDLGMIVRDGKEKKIPPRSMELLVELAEAAREEKSVNNADLLHKLWGRQMDRRALNKEITHHSNIVYRAVNTLRRDLDDDSRAPRYIKNIQHGYQLIAKVRFGDDYRRGIFQIASWTGRNPYVGLSAFDESHADVFHGRDQANVALLEAMRAQLNNDRRFLLMVGDSGCGKSSLLHAGALPWLRQEGGFDGLKSLSTAYCDLSAMDDGDAQTHIAKALKTWQLRGRDVFAPPADELAKAIVGQAEMATAAIARALSCANIHPDDQQQAHLLLTVDHAETLVTSQRIDDAGRQLASRLLEALCDCPRVMVVMIARVDYYPKLAASVPIVATRGSGSGYLYVPPPTEGEIAMMVRAPAALGGLVFEQNANDQSLLDDVLCKAAIAKPDALPLLQHVLYSLYEECKEQRELTFEAYRRIGGLTGAIAQRADAVYAEQSEAAQASLNHVLSLLIVVDPDNGNVSARRVLKSELTGEGARQLVEAFIRARLFVSSLDEGLPAFNVAHEALLRQWQRADDWAEENYRQLQALARFQRAADHWRKEKRDDHLLNDGQPLIEAQEAAGYFGDRLEPHHRAFLNASGRLSQRKRRLRIGAVVALAVLTFASLGFGAQTIRSNSKLAQSNRDVGRMSAFTLGNLATKLQQKGDLNLLEESVNEVIRLYEKKPASDLSTEDMINFARALRILGAVSSLKSEDKNSKQFLARANGIISLVLSAQPDSQEAIFELGQIAFWQGQIARNNKKAKKSYFKWKRYHRVSNRLVRVAPKNTDWQKELSYALSNLGTLERERGNDQAALRLFSASVRTKIRVLEHAPEDNDLRKDMIDTASSISSVLESIGEIDTAAKNFQLQTTALSLLVDRHREKKDWEFTLTNMLQFTAKTAVAQGDLEKAKQAITDCINRLTELTWYESDNQKWRRTLAIAHMEAAEIHRMRNELQDAKHQLLEAEKASRILQPKSERLPGNRRTHFYITALLANADDDAATPSLLDQSIHNLQQLHEAHRSDLDFAVSYTKALLLRGNRRASRNEHEAAERDWTLAIETLKPFVEAQKNYYVLDPWVRAHILLGKKSEIAQHLLFLDNIGYQNQDYLRAIALK